MTIGLNEARADIAGLLDCVQRGEDVLITRGPQPSMGLGEATTMEEARRAESHHAAVEPPQRRSPTRASRRTILMLYLDTSFLAPLFKEEERSIDVRSFLESHMARRATVSQRTRVEFVSLVAKNVRIGTRIPMQAVAADAVFEVFIKQTCSTLAVSGRDFDVARRLLSNHRSGLRAGDALHLAIASNDAASGVYSLDKIMVAAGVSLCLPMNAGFPTV